MPGHKYFANLLWQIADLLRGPYRPRQYERIMLPMTVLRHIDHRVAQSRAGRNFDTDRNHSIPQNRRAKGKPDGAVGGKEAT